MNNKHPIRIGMANQKDPMICVERNYYHMYPFSQEGQGEREIQEVIHIFIKSCFQLWKSSADYITYRRTQAVRWRSTMNFGTPELHGHPSLLSFTSWIPWMDGWMDWCLIKYFYSWIYMKHFKTFHESDISLFALVTLNENNIPGLISEI